MLSKVGHLFEALFVSALTLDVWRQGHHGWEDSSCGNEANRAPWTHYETYIYMWYARRDQKVFGHLRWAPKLIVIESFGKEHGSVEEVCVISDSCHIHFDWLELHFSLD